jgi:hypothetical protein
MTCEFYFCENQILTKDISSSLSWLEVGQGYLLYKTKSLSPMGLKIGQSLTDWKIQPFRPKIFLVGLCSKIL